MVGFVHIIAILQIVISREGGEIGAGRVKGRVRSKRHARQRGVDKEAYKREVRIENGIFTGCKAVKRWQLWFPNRRHSNLQSVGY
jgi:hypothetical protein